MRDMTSEVGGRSAANFGNLLVDGPTMLSALLEDLRAAEREIHVSVFLFFRDPIGEQIATILCEKAKSGLAVRVLLNVEKTAMGDPFSTGEKEMMRHDPNVDYDPTDVEPLCQQMRAAGVQVMNTNIDYDREVLTDDPRLRSVAAQIRGAIAIDDLHVDHRKIVVIDRCIAYTGGANIGAQYLYRVPFDPKKNAQTEAAEWLARGSREPWWKWHDSITRFEGPVVHDIETHFRERWILDGGAVYDDDGISVGRRDKPGGIPLTSAVVLTNEPNDRPNEIRELYVRLIEEAERSIFIENPYLYHPSIVEALVRAKKKRPELSIVLVLPAGEWNDNTFAHDAQQHAYAEYLENGIDVYEYQGHFTHFKIAVIDGRWSIHGSTNLNYRSLEDDKDFELVVLVDDEAMGKDVLTRVRDVDVRHSKHLSPGDLDGSLSGLRIKYRDPRTLLLISRRML
jgi:cardiolipin synthase